MNLDRHISSTQIVWGIGLLLGLTLAVMLGSAVGGQDFTTVALVLGAFVGISTFLALGKNYWLLIPFSFAAARLPAIPLGGRSVELPEMALAACSVMFILRIATRRDKITVWRAINIPFLLFIAWVGMVFLLHPVGLAMLGSSTGGGRFYLKLALAFSAFFILSSRSYSENNIFWVLVSLVIGAFFTLAYGITEYALLGPRIDPTTGMAADEFYTWHQELSVPAITITFILFARYSPKMIFGLQKPLLLLVYAVCIIAILLSGKRLAMAIVFLTPCIAAVMHRQYIYLGIAAVIASALLAFVVVGHGQWFRLPLVAQRTVSWLPGNWDQELAGMAGGADDWRAELRLWAWEMVKKDPLIGRGFAIDMDDMVAAIMVNQRGGGMDVQVAGAAIGRSWHNTWLGYAADFGIPLSVIQGLIYLTMLVVTYRCFRWYGSTSMFGVFALYLFIFTCRDLIATHTSGHSAMDAWQRWWMYGILVSVYYTLPKRKKSAPLPVKVPSAQREPASAMALPSQGRAALTGTSPWQKIPGRG